MIKNERQLQFTKTRLNEFNEALNTALASETHELGELYRKIEIDALGSQIWQLENEIKEYEALKKGEVGFVLVDSLSSLAEVLIKARIARGWTHAELADKLEMKEQQIQRYEMCNYSSANMARFSQIADALGVEYKGLKFRVASHQLPVPKGLDSELLKRAQSKIKDRGSLITMD